MLDVVSHSLHVKSFIIRCCLIIKSFFAWWQEKLVPPLDLRLDFKLGEVLFDLDRFLAPFVFWFFNRLCFSSQLRAKISQRVVFHLQLNLLSSHDFTSFDIGTLLDKIQAGLSPSFKFVLVARCLLIKVLIEKLLANLVSLVLSRFTELH